MPHNPLQSPKIIGGMERSTSYVDGEMLKEVSVPTEALLGGVNGAIGGGVVAAAMSAGATFLRAHGGETKGIGAKILDNMTGAHKYMVIGGTVAMGAFGAVLRYSRAQKHNEWAEKHYALLQQETGNTGHADAVASERKDTEQGRA